MHFLLAAESTGGLAALGLNWTGLAFQLFNFALLFLVLRKWVFPPVVRLLEQRRQRIDAGLKEAEAAHAAKKEADAERAKIIEQAKTEASALVEAARTEAKKQGEKIVADAHASADGIATQAQQRTQRDQRAAREELMHELGGIVATATATVTRSELTPKGDTAVIKKALQEAGK